MEYIHRAATEMHHDNPKVIFILPNNMLYANLTSEDFVCTIVSGLNIVNSHHLHHFPPKTLL